MPLKTQSSHKKCEFQRYPSQFSGTACYEHVSSNGKFQTLGKAQNKQFWGRCWDKIGFRRSQADVCSKRRDCDFSTDIHRQNQRLRHEFLTESLVRGSDSRNGRCHVAGVDQTYDRKSIRRWCAQNTKQKISIRLERQKKQLWEDIVGRRRQALAPRPWIYLISSRPSSNSLALPDTEQVGRGLSLC